jgi:phage anti-repressor protein
MNTHALVPTFEGQLNDTQQTLCNARDLHSFLESKQQFADWIKVRLEKCRFQLGRDYLLHKFTKQVPHQGGARTALTTEYHLSLYAAEHIAMMEGSEIGFQVRDYFIRVRNQSQKHIPSIGVVRQYGLVHPESLLTPEEKKLLLEARKDWQAIYDMTLAGLNSIEIADKLCRDDSGVRGIIRRMRGCGILPPDSRRLALQIERAMVAHTKKQATTLQ